MRTSSDQYKDGKLFNGFDYDNQAWVLSGEYQDCGHPEDMECKCYGRKNKGKKNI